MRGGKQWLCTHERTTFAGAKPRGPLLTGGAGCGLAPVGRSERRGPDFSAAAGGDADYVRYGRHMGRSPVGRKPKTK